MNSCQLASRQKAQTVSISARIFLAVFFIIIPWAIFISHLVYHPRPQITPFQGSDTQIPELTWYPSNLSGSWSMPLGLNLSRACSTCFSWCFLTIEPQFSQGCLVWWPLVWNMALKLWVYLYRNLCLPEWWMQGLLSKRIIRYSTVRGLFHGQCFPTWRRHWHRMRRTPIFLSFSLRYTRIAL